MRCTVLGGQGFIGSHLARHLETLDFEVYLPAREELVSLSGPLGHVFYCIGLTADFRSRPFATVDAHVSMLANIVQRADFESFTYLSSTRVYARALTAREDSVLGVAPQDPSDLYNLSKLMGEALCLCSGRQGVKVARLSNVLGIGMGADNFVGGLLKEARGGRIRLRSHVDSVKDYVLVDDAVRVLARIACEGRERIYNVASGAQIAHGEWLSLLQRETNCVLETDPHAPLQNFPPIDTGRLNAEFNIEPGFDVATLPNLIKMW